MDVDRTTGRPRLISSKGGLLVSRNFVGNTPSFHRSKKARSAIQADQSCNFIVVTTIIAANSSKDTECRYAGQQNVSFKLAHRSPQTAASSLYPRSEEVTVCTECNSFTVKFHL